MTKNPVAHLDEIEPTSIDAGDRFGGERRALGRAAGGQQIGASHYRIPPGRTAWPAHYHAANEEAIFVLEGEGRMRFGDRSFAVRSGDWVALPAGPNAHQLVNDGTTDLVYLCVSTQHPTDICVYPDSGKVGVFGGAAPGGDAGQRHVEGFFRLDGKVPYYDGEL